MATVHYYDIIRLTDAITINYDFDHTCSDSYLCMFKYSDSKFLDIKMECMDNKYISPQNWFVPQIAKLFVTTLQILH